MKRYEIRWCHLDPVEGSEMGKVRPVVIVSLDVLNDKLKTVTVCPLTSRLHSGWRSRVAIRCAGRSAEIAVDQIRTMAKSRLGAVLAALTTEEAKALRETISEMYAEASAD
jgi:mRNA interferase MazF